MERRDYLLREIEKIGVLLRALRQKLFGGEKENFSVAPEWQIANLKEMLLSDTNLDLDKLLSLDQEKTQAYLSEVSGFNVANIELLAQTLAEIGFEHHSVPFLEKALQLFEICNLLDRTWSPERESNIRRIKEFQGLA
jgi:hypothetical protein